MRQALGISVVVLGRDTIAQHARRRRRGRIRTCCSQSSASAASARVPSRAANLDWVALLLANALEFLHAV